MSGKIKGWQIEDYSISLEVNNTPLNILSYTVSSTQSGKQLINKEFLDNELGLKLDDSQLNDNIISTNSLWSSDKISTEILSLSSSIVNLIDDQITATDSTWSSNKIDSELDLKLDDSQLNDSAATGSTNSLWSVNKIYIELEEKLDKYLTQSYIFLGNENNVASASETYKLYEDNVGDYFLTNNYLYGSYSQLEIGQKVESTYQVAEKTPTNWLISKKQENLNISTTLDLLDNNILSNEVLDLGSVLGSDIYILDANTTSNNLSFTVSKISGLSDDYNIEIKVSDNIDVNIIGTTYSNPLLNDILLYNSTLRTLSNSKYDSLHLRKEGIYSYEYKWDITKIDSIISGSVSGIIKDNTVATNSTWSSNKIDSELDLKLDGSQLNDSAATGSTNSLWSVNKIYTELEGLSASLNITIDNIINDTATASDSTWSSNKIDSELDLKLDDSQLNDSAATGSTNSLWSVNKIYTEISGLSVSLNTEIDNLINDSVTASDTTWSSNKIDSELDLKLDDSQLNDSAATGSTNSLWSVNKIYTEISGLSASLNTEIDNLINDTATASDSTWSSNKIDSEISGVSSSIFTYRPIGTTITSDVLVTNLSDNRFYDVDSSSATFSIDINDTGSTFDVGAEIEFSPVDLTFPISFTSSVNTLQSANNFLEMDLVYGATIIKKVGTNVWRLFGNLK